MEEKRIYKKNSIFIKCLIAFVLALSFNFVSAQERITPKFKYEFKKAPKEKGCGTQLNEEGVRLQDKGLDLFFVRGKTAEAVDLLENAIKLEPRLYISYLQLAFYYLEVKKSPSKTITLLNKAKEQCPRAPLIYYALGESYAGNEQHQDAITNYNKAEELGMELLPPFFYNRGNSYAKVKEYDRAIENYKKALELDSKKFDAWRNLIIAYYKKGDKKSALEYAKRLEELDSNGNFGAWAKEAIRQMK